MSNETYEAVEFPRGNVVVKITDGDRRHPMVVEEFPSMPLAEKRAAELRLDRWLEDRPPEVEAFQNWIPDVEGRLFAILKLDDA